MVSISFSLINNIDKNRLLKFLAEEECEQEEYEGMEIDIMLSKMLEEKTLKLSKLNEFLFDELFYGMHRDINIYKIRSFRKAKYVNDWIRGICNDYDVDSVNYNKIVQTYATKDSGERISAIKTIYDEKNEITNIKLIFVKQIEILKEGSITTSYSYTPVELDFKRKIIVIKARHRKNVHNDKHKPKYLMNDIFHKITSKMQIQIIPFENSHQSTLYKMSRGLVDELFANIPAFSSIEKMEEPNEELINNITQLLPIENIVDGSINKKVMDIKDELYKMLQELILADYFFNRDEDNIWDIDISAIITSIRFDDSKNATARLAGENRIKHIFNSKSFMGLRKSLEMVKEVQALSIAFKKGRSTIHVKYDATDNIYLNVLFTTYKPYDEDDFDKVWERFIGYESDISEKVTEVCERKLG